MKRIVQIASNGICASSKRTRKLSKSLPAFFFPEKGFTKINHLNFPVQMKSYLVIQQESSDHSGRQEGPVYSSNSRPLRLMNIRIEWKISFVEFVDLDHQLREKSKFLPSFFPGGFLKIFRLITFSWTL